MATLSSIYQEGEFFVQCFYCERGGHFCQFVMYADFLDSTITISSLEFDISACILVRRLFKTLPGLYDCYVPEGPEFEFM